eukprot:gene16257-22141_t
MSVESHARVRQLAGFDETNRRDVESSEPGLSVRLLISSSKCHYPSSSLAEAYQRAGQWKEVSYVKRDGGEHHMKIINPGERTSSDINCYYNCGKASRTQSRINLVTTAITGPHKNDGTEEEVIILEPFDLLLDNQSTTVHIFNDSRMLKNIRNKSNREPVCIQGIGGDLVIDQFGEAGVFGTVYYHPKAMANVISFGALEDEHDGVGSIVYEPNSRSFEVLSLAQVTVTENERLFTKREVEAANKKTKELKRILAYPSDADLIQLLKYGIKNAPVDTNDVKRAAIIYGPDWAELKGKTVMNKPSSVIKIDPIMHPLHQLQQVLHVVDIMFVEGIPFLIS